MTSPRVVAFSVLLGLLAAGGFTLGACVSDGDDGMQGPAGPAGPQGPGVSDGDGGMIPPLSGACTQPCHTFNGVVDQWRFSNHSHPQNNEIGGGPCGNCHAVDGIQQRVANKFVAGLDGGTVTGVDKGHINYRVGATAGAVNEIGYAGASAIGRIHCTTCHDFNPQTDPHVVGRYVANQAPLRVAGGVNDTVMLEKTPDASAGIPTGTSLNLRTSNLCGMCHKSRKDIAFYITSPNTNVNSYRWGPHDGPQTDVFSGKGGYELAGRAYANSEHITIANACVSCHMQPVANNANVPDHTMKPQLAYCKSMCHSQYTGSDFNIDNGRAIVTTLLVELQSLLNNAGYLSRSEAAPYSALDVEQLADRQFQLDLARPIGNVPADSAGALYNYLVIARSKDLGVHNPRYTKLLLWDSIFQMKGSAPASMAVRPPA